MLPSVRNWRVIFLTLVPLALLPLVFLGLGQDSVETKRWRCGYVILLMGAYWVTEAMPLAITALLPVVLFPLFDIASTGDVTINFMKETGMMFIGGIVLALSIQCCGLHKRIALNTMLLIGTSPWRLLLGVMVTTMFLSCWIVVNTAVAAMIVPIVGGLVDGLEDYVSPTRKAKLKKLYMLSVAYAANIGGTAIIIGSNPNLIYRELISGENISQNGKYTDLTFVSWIAFNLPIAVINLFIIWFILGAMHLGFSSPKLRFLNVFNAFKEEKSGLPDEEQVSEEHVKTMLRQKLKELGKISFHETVVIILFSTAVLLWFTRDPQFVSGWSSWFSHYKSKIGDSSVAILITILMFVIPREIKYLRFRFEGSSETIMTWQYIQEHFPWNVILLVGGGLAISDGANKSGLSAWVGDQLLALNSLSQEAILAILLVVISCATEVISNSATISLVTPILIALSRSLKIHPLYFSLPGAIACQYAFMLPTSNPPNAIVFLAGKLKIMDMLKAGFFLNFICLSILYVMNIFWGQVIFNYSNYTYADANNLTIV